MKIRIGLLMFVTMAVWAGVMSCEIDHDQRGNGDRHSEALWSSIGLADNIPEFGAGFAVDAIPKDPFWSFEADNASAELGDFITLCDLNGDGYLDLAAGAEGFSGGQDDEGKIFIFSGTASGFPASPDDTIESNVVDGFMGAVSCSGDMNDDGYDDLIVGYRGYGNGQNQKAPPMSMPGRRTGFGCCRHGRMNPTETSPGLAAMSWCNVNGDAYDDVIVGAPRYTNGQNVEGRIYAFESDGSAPSNTPDWTYESNSAGVRLSEVACAGDVNGDGYDDLLAAAPSWIAATDSITSAGKVFLFLGSAAGLPASPDWTYTGTFNVGSLGRGLAGAGDVNGDGYDDIIVGSPGATQPENNEGLAYVFHGSAGGPSLTPDATIERNLASGGLGYGVATAGDFDEDGYDDVVVTVTSVTAAAAATGISVLYYRGGPSGLGAAPDPEWWIDLAGGTSLSAKLATVPDMNDDGYSEIVLGQPFYSNGEDTEGRVAIISPIRSTTSAAIGKPSFRSRPRSTGQTKVRRTTIPPHAAVRRADGTWSTRLKEFLTTTTTSI
ncbi:MAG: FG-GAP-like repeat-containing protein [Deltaproteobacteria bacterium]|nr:FG-GAP-like repeat-containing protein [Deltaproteobacteria bacterium]